MKEPRKGFPMNPKETPSTIILTSTRNTGIGLWTSICLSFANAFGRSCERYNQKARSVIYLIKKELEKQMSAHPDYEFGDIRLTSDKPLSFTGSVTGHYIGEKKEQKGE